MQKRRPGAHTDTEDNRAKDAEKDLSTYAESAQNFGLVIIALLFLLPARLGAANMEQVDQSANHSARQVWEQLLDADPEPNAILISNDRNEIVPLYYLQAVEGQRTDLSGLFPLIRPDGGFDDVAETIATALEQGGNSPVYLTKPMPGLEIRFRLDTAGPLIRVEGPAIEGEAQNRIDLGYGPLTLQGYDLTGQAEEIVIDLYWEVNEPLLVNATATLQLFDAAGEKIGQLDRPVGGDYYPSMLWKEGERLRDRFVVTIPADGQAASMITGLYSGPALTPLAPFLEIPLTRPLQSE